MSTRSRRSRGRPPKAPLSTNRTNFLRKPKAYQNREQPNSGSASPVSHLLSSGRQDRRAAASRGRNFVSQLIAEDDEISSLPEFEDRSSDITDLDNNDSLFPDEASDEDASLVCEESGAESSDNESLSTVSSSVSKRKLIPKRPKTPDIVEDKDIPALELPSSATDLTLPTEYVLSAIGVYEVLRHYWTILRLSPFTFEDFSACLLSEDQSNLLTEIHITLLKAIFREEESSSSAFGPQDLKDSINISLFFLDAMMWPEVLRAYLDSEKHPEFRAHLSILESPNYPFVPFMDKLKVLQTLTDLFLGTTNVREEILNEGNIHYDDHCRACHKLGDLLCCETCSAVYHLTCVDPPMDEVPEEDWLCSVCRAHQIKGVTDCVSEAERSGLLCRQEPLGYDRHARKYWFLCRRIIIESENEVWYYSTKVQLEELLETLDQEYEPDLLTMINEIKDDIIKQMAYTEELTAAVKGSRKSMLDVENAALVKIQVERSLQKKKEEEEKAAREEEERQKREEEERKKKEEEERALKEEEEKADDNDTSTEEQKTEEIEKDDKAEDKEEVIETEVVTTEMEETTDTVEVTAGDQTMTETTKTTTTTTTVTTVTSTTKSSSPSPTSDEATETTEGEDEPPSKKAKVDSAGDCASLDTSAGGDASVKQDSDKTIVLSNQSALAEAIKSTSDGKPKVISLQSLLPAARQTLLNAVDKGGEDGGKGDASAAGTKTVLLVNREGGKVTLQVQRKPVSETDAEESTSDTSIGSGPGAASRKMITRSRTGSLTPKLFTDSVTLTTTSMRSSGKMSEEKMSFSKDGDVTVTHTRRKISMASSAINQSIYFKLGAEGKYKQYQNQFTCNTLALNKHQHNEERDKKRHLSHKFSLTQSADFKWNGNILGNRMSTLATLRLTITQLEGAIQAPFLHINWPNHRQSWQKAVQMCQSPRDFAFALAVLESCIKPCVMNAVWFDSLGHLRLKRITSADREEWKKKEKEQRKNKENDDDVRQVVWIKYTLGLKHQVWKLKGEEYRVTGGNGWQWVSCTRNFKNHTPQDSVGLRMVAQRLKAEKVKEARTNKAPVKNLEKTFEDQDSGKKVSTSEKEGAETKPISESSSAAAKCANSDDVEMQDDQGVASKTEEGAKEKGVKEEAMETDEAPVSHDKDTTEPETKTISGEKAPVLHDKDTTEPETKTISGETEAENKSSNMLPPESKDEKMDTTEAGISDEKPAAPVKPGPKVSTPRKDRAQISCEEYLNYMKYKYLDDKDAAFALDVLKKLPPKVDAELINVSDSLNKRIYYPRLSKPPSKLDLLLEKRMKQDEFERKQRLTIETQIALKEKLTQAIESIQRKKDALEEKERENALSNGEVKDVGSHKSAPYVCYSLLCRESKNSNTQCYSLSCRTASKNKKAIQKESENVEMASNSSSCTNSAINSTEGTPANSRPGSPNVSLAERIDDSSKTTNKDSDSKNAEDDVDVESSKDAEKSSVETQNANSDKENETNTKKEKSIEKDVDISKNVTESNGGETSESKNSEEKEVSKLDISTEDEEIDIMGEAPKTLLSASSFSDSLRSSSDHATKPTTGKNGESDKKVDVKEDKAKKTEEKSSSSKSASVSDIVRNLVIKTMAEKAVAGGEKGSVLNAQALASAVANMSMDDLKAKLPPRRTTREKFKLAKFTRAGVKKLPLVAKTGRLPDVHKFQCASSKKRSVLILERHELRKLARLASRRESVMFNYNCKSNHATWPYPCPRPVFRTAWRYRTMNLHSLSAAAVQLRILWACIKWDDMASKPPAGGTNTVSTETEITTTELLKRREVGTDLLRSEFLVRKIVVPLGVPEKPKEKYTPQRSGLRVRKRVEPTRQTEPSVAEVWVPEESLELWEIKQFGEKLEKQRLALKEKVAAERAAAAAAAPKATTSSSVGTSSVSVGTSSGPPTTALMKAHMEQQLKQQRQALTQRKVGENQGGKVTSNISTLSGGGIVGGSGTNQPTTIIINNSAQAGRAGGPVYKTLTVSAASPSSLLAPGAIRTMQPKTVITGQGSLLGTQLRPGIRVQLPGGLTQLRPGTITLAPKPGGGVVVGGSTTSATPGTTTITRFVTPGKTAIGSPPSGSQLQAGGKTHTIQIRPQAAGQPVQNLHFTQTPGGQLQVRGLLPGQVIQRMADGKLQIISSPQQQQQQQGQQTSSALPSAVTATPPRPTITIRPQQPQQILVTPPAATTATVTTTAGQPTPSRLMLPTGLPASAIRQVLVGPGGVSRQLIINRPGGGAQVISAQSLASIIGNTGGPAVSSATIVSPPSAVPGLGKAVVISAPNAVSSNPDGSSISTTTARPSQPSAQPVVSTLKLGSALLTSSTDTSATPTSGQSLLGGQVISASSLLQRSNAATSLLNLGAAGTSTPKLLSLPSGSISGSQPILARNLDVLATPQSQLVIRPGGASSSGQPAKIISLNSARPPTPILTSTAQGIQRKILSAAGTPQLVLPQSQASSTPRLNLAPVTSILPTALTSQALSPGAGIEVTSPEPGLASPPTGTASSPGASIAAPKYAITPAVVEQVVRQALMQNQAPEIQQKLLAMQKQIQLQSGTPGGVPVPVGGIGSSIFGAGGSARRPASSGAGSSSSSRSQASHQVQASEHSARSKSKALTAEQKEEATRNSICSQVMKYMLDRIEREEKQEQRNKKRQESAEEKQKRLVVVNQQKALYKHKEALKKEILRKRSLMEKNLKQEIYNEMAEKLKKSCKTGAQALVAAVATASAANNKSPGAGTPVNVKPPDSSPAAQPAPTPVAVSKTSSSGRKVIETPRAAANAAMTDKSGGRKRKQKIISTGIKGSLNPKERLYCVCKKPYDESKFYIGCDLCSNWFHGSCVGISAERAKHIDSYICEDCRKQQENTSEELYCLCRTPYDENQFYIGCDRCQDWFHGRCVGISESEADDYDVYLCPNCQKQEKSDPIAQKPLKQSEYQQLAKLLKDLQAHKMAWPFLQPVDPTEVPDYYDIVSEPMDLTIVQAKLNAKAYTRLNDFTKDMTKIFDNCRLYNPADTPYFQCAEVVETYFAHRIKSLRSSHKL